MHLKQLFLVFVLLGIINAGHSLKCYICSGSPSSDCGKSKEASMVLHQCHTPRLPIHTIALSDTGNFEVVCLAVTLSNFTPNLVERNCGIFPADSDPCTVLKKKLHVASCKSCTTDKCNLRSEDETENSVNYGNQY